MTLKNDIKSRKKKTIGNFLLSKILSPQFDISNLDLSFDLEMGNGSTKKVNRFSNIDINAERVDLRNKNIKDIRKLPVMMNLKWLNLSNNEIRILPSQISGHFPLLQSLRLTGNQISEIPSSFLELTNLRMLDLGKNNFTTISETIFLITSLKELNMQMNKLSMVIFIF